MIVIIAVAIFFCYRHVPFEIKSVDCLICWSSEIRNKDENEHKDVYEGAD